MSGFGSTSSRRTVRNTRYRNIDAGTQEIRRGAKTVKRNLTRLFAPRPAVVLRACFVFRSAVVPRSVLSCYAGSPVASRRGSRNGVAPVRERLLIRRRCAPVASRRRSLVKLRSGLRACRSERLRATATAAARRPRGAREMLGAYRVASAAPTLFASRRCALLFASPSPDSCRVTSHKPGSFVGDPSPTLATCSIRSCRIASNRRPVGLGGAPRRARSAAVYSFRNKSAGTAPALGKAILLP